MAMKKSSTTPSKRKSSTTSFQNKKKKSSKHSNNPNLIPLGTNSKLLPPKQDQKQDQTKKKKKKEVKNKEEEVTVLLSTVPAAQQLSFFLDRFQAANGITLSSIELEAFNDTCMVELSQSMDQDVDNISKHLNATFGESSKEVLCEGKLSDGAVDAGSPAVIVISTSALRSLELLRGVRPLTKECRPAKLFAKHLKVEDQVASLKDRVNIASGTPSRIKKLIDMEALSLSRLAVIVLDMHRDAKGYSILTLPQVSSEFWDLYKSHFNERLLQGTTRICFYGPIPRSEVKIGQTE